jgi:hypothetical protein
VFLLLKLVFRGEQGLWISDEDFGPVGKLDIS